MTRDTPVACNLGALSAAERAQRSALSARVRERVVSVRETEGGFRLHLPGDATLYRQALDLIDLERRCCPFLELRLVFSSDEGPVYLDIGGNAEAKAFLVSSGVLGCAGWPDSSADIAPDAGDPPPAAG